MRMTRTVRAAIVAGLLMAGPSLAQDVDPFDPFGDDAEPRPTAESPTRLTPPATRDTRTRPIDPVAGLPGAIDPDTYRLGPGDVLMFQIWGAVSRAVPLEVDPEGTLQLPGAGPLRVDGRVLSEVRRDALSKLRGRYRNVQLDIRLARPRTFRVYLTGRVENPGPVLANGSTRVADVVVPSVLQTGASRRNIEVLRRDGTREIADLDLFLRAGNSSLNPWLRDGDVLHVPTATEFVYALGAVAEPGRFELGPRDSLRTLLRLAGDPLPSAEAGRALYLSFVRDPFRPDSSWLVLGDIYRGSANFPLQDGARLYVQYIPEYRQQDEATILGEVSRPGSFPIDEGRSRLSHLVESAEGFLPSADLSAIRVHRPNPDAAQRDPELERLLQLSREELTASEYEVLRTKLAARSEDYRVDWQRVKGNPELDLLLRQGDIVRVERLIPSVRVDGEVRRPGIINYVAGQRLSDYIRQSGGFTDRAWQGKVRVRRAVSGQTLLARNVSTLDPGDFVWVPEKPDVTVWEQAKDVLTALATVATIVIAIRSVN